MKTILLADDHPMLRQGVAQLIAMEENLCVVGEASDGREAIEKAIKLKPDMVLLDLNMKGLGGIDTLVELRRRKINTKVVIYTVSDNEDDMSAALCEGADGYLLKDCEPEELLRDIKRAAEEDEQVFSPQLAEIMARALTKNNQKEVSVVPDMTPREKTILKLIATGKTNKHIARNLNITESTVKVHVKNLLKKLSLRSRVEAAIWAVENNIGEKQPYCEL